VHLTPGGLAQAGREEADSHTACQREGLKRGTGASLACGWGAGGVCAPSSQMGSRGRCGLAQLQVTVSGAEEGATHPARPATHPGTWPRALPILLFQTSLLGFPSTESPPQHVVHK